MRTKKKVNAQAVCDAWNSAHRVGAPVTVTRDNGDVLTTNTRSVAWVLGDDAVVMVIGITGGYLLERVAPAQSTL